MFRPIAALHMCEKLQPRRTKFADEIDRNRIVRHAEKLRNEEKFFCRIVRPEKTKLV